MPFSWTNPFLYQYSMPHSPCSPKELVTRMWCFSSPSSQNTYLSRGHWSIFNHPRNPQVYMSLTCTHKLMSQWNINYTARARTKVLKRQGTLQGGTSNTHSGMERQGMLGESSPLMSSMRVLGPLCRVQTKSCRHQRTSPGLQGTHTTLFSGDSESRRNIIISERNLGT